MQRCSMAIIEETTEISLDKKLDFMCDEAWKLKLFVLYYYSRDIEWQDQATTNELVAKPLVW